MFGISPSPGLRPPSPGGRGLLPLTYVIITNTGGRSQKDRAANKKMEVYLVDGTYEWFRHFFAVPSLKNDKGQEIGAVRGVVNSIKGMIDRGATHIGVATDHIIESFRNDLYPGYKTGAGIPPDLYSQFPILEETLQEAGIVVWPMIEFEADDAMAS